jgi:hypothetical protein
MQVTRRNVLWAIVVTGLAVIGIAGPGQRVSAHGGGLDGYGCHNDRKAGTYHCHRGPCAGRHYSSKAEMLRDRCSQE